MFNSASNNNNKKEQYKIMENYRKIKISSKFQRTKWNEKNVPALIMQGEYMRQAGFGIGTECSVKIESGRITIISL